MSVPASTIPSETCPLVVAVPVRNEAALLPRFLTALAEQRERPEFTLCIAFDGCDDDSVAIVAAMRGVLPFAVLTVEGAAGAPNAGSARRCAMALALDQGGEGALLISTDADSRPDVDWLTRNLAALAVADVVAGRIVRDAAFPSPLQDRIEGYYDALFALRRTIDPVPWEAPVTHHYTSGASLALRAGTYRALGGFESVPSAEDARLVDAAHAAGYRVRHDAAVRVTTSSRRMGRAEGGLADHLRRLDGGDASATMAHPADAVWRYHGHAAARAAFADLAGKGAAFATRTGRPIADIHRIAADAPNAEAFAMRVVPAIAGGEQLVTLDVAERELALLTRTAVAA